MLSGIRIIEIEGIGPAPFSAMHLADLGADVIVVHRKGGPGLPILPDAPIVDRGKRSIELDLKDQDDVATLKKLIATADGLVEGFRPGVMEKLGLGPDACHAVNPKLVYGRMTGWGQDGPMSAMAGHDMNYIGLSGALWYASLPGQPPVAPPTLVGDIGGGALYLSIGMLAGILNARSTGKGTVVDAAIVDGSAHMMNLLMALGRKTPTVVQACWTGHIGAAATFAPMVAFSVCNVWNQSFMRLFWTFWRWIAILISRRSLTPKAGRRPRRDWLSCLPRSRAITGQSCLPTVTLAPHRSSARTRR